MNSCSLQRNVELVLKHLGSLETAVLPVMAQWYMRVSSRQARMSSFQRSPCISSCNEIHFRGRPQNFVPLPSVVLLYIAVLFCTFPELAHCGRIDFSMACCFWHHHRTHVLSLHHSRNSSVSPLPWSLSQRTDAVFAATQGDTWGHAPPGRVYFANTPTHSCILCSQSQGDTQGYVLKDRLPLTTSHDTHVLSPQRIETDQARQLPLLGSLLSVRGAILARRALEASSRPAVLCHTLPGERGVQIRESEGWCCE